MRNAALFLGLIGGLLTLVIGFFTYGYVAFIDWFGEVPEIATQVEQPVVMQAVSLLAPVFAIAGAAMARARALWGGVLLLLASVGIYAAFGFGVFTVFPLAFCTVAGVLAIAAGRPDKEVAHF